MDELLKLISTYGLAIVISGLVLYFAIKLGNILVDSFKHKHTAKKHDDLSETRSRVSSVISSMLDRIVLKTHADRAYVFEFHNGHFSMGGLPFLKMSNHYEALGEGATSEANRRKDMSLQLYHSFTEAIAKKDYLIMKPDDRTGEFSPLVYETLAERGIHTTVRAKITDIHKRPIGYFGIDFCKPVTDEAARACVETVIGAAAELGALLCVNK